MDTIHVKTVPPQKRSAMCSSTGDPHYNVRFRSCIPAHVNRIPSRLRQSPIDTPDPLGFVVDIKILRNAILLLTTPSPPMFRSISLVDV